MRGRGYHFMGRHHGGRVLGRFGRGFMDGGSRGFGMGRKLAATDLQLLILRLLRDKPRHGYEITKDLEERSRGFYVPSPGMIYPALAHLEEIGHATVEADANRKRYHITEAGRGYLEQYRTAAESLLTQFERVAERMEQVLSALHTAQSLDEAAGKSMPGHPDDLMRARWDLKLALDATPRRSREEADRIAEILRRAAAEIIAAKPRG